MTIRRCIGMMLAASVLILVASVAEAGPFFFRRAAMAPAYNAYPYGYVAPQDHPYAPFGPYTAQLPAYGVIPLPLATHQMLGLDRATEYTPSTTRCCTCRGPGRAFIRQCRMNPRRPRRLTRLGRASRSRCRRRTRSSHSMAPRLRKPA